MYIPTNEVQYYKEIKFVCYMVNMSNNYQEFCLIKELAMLPGIVQRY